MKRPPTPESTISEADRLARVDVTGRPTGSPSFDFEKASPIDLLQEWRIADRMARTLDQTIFRASMAALNGAGEAPTDDERDRAVRARALANDLFQVAMDEVARKAKARSA
jgi:hypothetical protein